MKVGVIAMIRLVLTLSAAAFATPFFVLVQIFALRTGLIDERRAPRAWHRLLTRLLGLRVHIHGKLAANRPLLIAANHISWTDIMVIGAIADVHFVAKSEVASWPVMGRLAKLQRTHFVERGARRRAGAQVGEIATRMVDGDPMVLFAEGTTGDGNLVLPFKSTLFGAAQMALEANGGAPVAIQPVAIAYTRLQGMPMGRQHRPHAAWIGDRTLLPHIGELLREGAVDVEVHFGAPVGFGPGASRKQVAREIESRVRAMMAAALRNPV